MLDDIYDPSNDGNLFYDLLPKRGPHAFSKFIDILSQTGEEHSEAAILLQNEYSKDYTPVPYTMTSEPIGFCLIIINEIFDDSTKLSDRFGSQVDGPALQSLFDSLGYFVIVKWNLTGEEMESSLLEFSQNPSLSQVDFIVVFILTHGDRIKNCDVLRGTDAVPIFKDDIYDMFDNNRCTRLLGKPKIFFFQACRGNEDNMGYYECQNASSDSIPQQGITGSEKVIINHRPSLTDMIVVHSTLPYQTSLRDDKGAGSWLCLDIVDVFSVDYLRHDLETMLKSVCKRMEERRSEDKTKQTIHIELFGMTGTVKFGQGHTEDIVEEMGNE